MTDTLKRLHDRKCPRVYLRAYLSVLGQNRDRLSTESQQKAVSRWRKVPADVLEDYFHAFGAEVEPVAGRADHAVPVQE